MFAGASPSFRSRMTFACSQFAVGMPVTRPPPHRSRRAALPHRALASGQTQKRWLGYGCTIRAEGIHLFTSVCILAQVRLRAL